MIARPPCSLVFSQMYDLCDVFDIVILVMKPYLHFIPLQHQNLDLHQFGGITCQGTRLLGLITPYVQ